MSSRFALSLLASIFFAFTNSLTAATVPAVTVLSPAKASSDGSTSNTFEGHSPIHYVAYATSPDCASGISAMKIYSGAGNVAYQTRSSYLDVQLPLKPNSYNTIIRAWDNCGGVSSVTINDTVTPSTGQVVVTMPVSNFVYAPQTIQFVATATTTCPKGVATMGIYTSPHHKVFGQRGSKLDGFIQLGAGTYNAVVQEWDNCGGSSSTPVHLIVKDGGFLQTNQQFAYTPDASRAVLQTFWIGSDCALNPVLGNPSSTHFDPIAVVKNSGFIFVLNKATKDLSIYRDDAAVNGGLTQVPNSPFSLHEADGYTPTGLAVPSSGSVLSVFVTNSNSDPTKGGTVSEFNFNIFTGTFTEIAGSPLKLRGNVQPTGIYVGGFDINAGKWLFVTNGSSISVLGGADSGARDEVEGSPFPAPGRTAPSAGIRDLAVLTNDYIYTADSDNSISAFQVGSHGQLTPLPGSPYANPDDPGGAGNPVSIAMSLSTNDGQTVDLYALDAGANDIAVFAVNFNTGIPTYVRSEQQGRVLATPSNRLRIGNNPDASSSTQCLVTSNGYSMVVNSDGTTSLVPGSPFLPSGTYPSLEIQPF